MHFIGNTYVHVLVKFQILLIKLFFSGIRINYARYRELKFRLYTLELKNVENF